MAPSNSAVCKPPRISARNAEFATVLVGAESVTFFVHKELLTYHSAFFRAALNSGFEEAATSTVRLEEVGVKVFEFFVHWLYHQRFPNKYDDAELFRIWDGGVSLGHVVGSNYIRLHVFGDKYDVPGLKRQTLDHLFRFDEFYIPLRYPVVYAFNNLCEDSPLCRLLVHIYCDRANQHDWDFVVDERHAMLPATFLKLVLQRYSEISRRDHPTRALLELCDYHEHKDDEEREACAEKRAT